MSRTATRFPSLLIAGAGAAALVTVALGVSAMHSSDGPAPASDVTSPVAVSPVAIAAPAPAVRAEAAPVARAEAKIATEPVGTAGLRVAMDPETGTYGLPATGDESFSQSTEGLTQVTLPDGSVMIDLEGRFQEYSVMVRDASGRLQVRCVHDPAQALDPRHVHHAFETALPSAER